MTIATAYNTFKMHRTATIELHTIAKNRIRIKTLINYIHSTTSHLVRALGNTSDEHCANTVYKQINDIFVIRYNGQILPDIVTLKKTF